MADAETNDCDIFWVDPIEGQTPPELSTGNPEDDQLLRQIAARVVSLDRPRDWIHYLTAADEPAAQMAARLLLKVAYKEAGFSVEIFAPDQAGEPYCVVATREGLAVTADLVRSSRELFEIITSHIPGTAYDGWEVSIDEDEYLEAITDPDDLSE